MGTKILPVQKRHEESLASHLRLAQHSKIKRSGTLRAPENYQLNS